ncbi:cation:proton antiporter family protein [Pseudoteredinibacter isoporae]|uniref:Putative Kef-type K+ transport protein n=1 Tax=Pseudoteredinibacter isoporae TaxID=570281 RepID=A0A7X0JQQ6_9GAMM|nr:cation:proton antiporter family protein [Pseudoteredinibacter isoporae]MBB6520557.1 putative Kef-type K+ transport protein [Pseudoteredinibacter isoporae]NHO86124.1 cation:proton antiporter [Pseudoteredinibacter isoporae]NIB25425.1 cation:proton antiporter [Pseudoteredinibacter isoporae]
MLDPIIIIIALFAGLSFKRIGFPPMLGYLLAGFLIHGFGLDSNSSTIIDTIANAGVTLLLFTIGLKLNVRDLIAPQIWAVASSHMLISTVSFGILFMMLAPWIASLSSLDSTAIWTIAFALSFSSTVFAVKVFEQHGETSSIHANVAIGILIIQDLAAVFFLAMSTGKSPDWTALLLFLLIPARPFLHRLLASSGHGELLVLFGIGIAFGGAKLFELCNVKGDLGALVFGVLLAGGIKSNELSKALLSFKDIFLVGFFLSIGLNGLPDISMLILALGLAFAGGFKPLLFYWLMTITHLRARTSLLASLSLSNYSEFGLIVAALAASNGVLPQDWVVTLAIAVALSFFIAAPINDKAHGIYNRYRHLFTRFELEKRLPQEEGPDLEQTDVLVLGMGRVGVGAYRYLRHAYPGRVVGVEEGDKKSKRLLREGYRVVRADASDQDFWQQVNLDSIRIILISLANHGENVEVVELIQRLGYKGQIAVIARFPDEIGQLKRMGCVTYNLYYEGGHGFAEHVVETLEMIEDGQLN